MSFLYWPDTNHPSLARAAASIRRFIAEGRPAINHAVLPVWHLADYMSEPDPMDDPVKIEILTVHQAAGAAPYVGRPFAYMWKVAIGEGNRWVAGPAEIHYLPEDAMA